jgi:serine/threonine protein kinase
MLVMDYASGGDLHSYLQKEFQNITWNKKLSILYQISSGYSTLICFIFTIIVIVSPLIIFFYLRLEAIHSVDFIHRDLHSGNILLTQYDNWKIGDFGLSKPACNTTINNEIYGVIPYIAPEIFSGSKFSKASDIYSLGMIMWELTTGCKPFANVEHDISLIYKIIDGKRPEITNDTPECFASLMKRCWDPDPLKRPYVSEISSTINTFERGYEHRRQWRYFNQDEDLKILSTTINGIEPRYEYSKQFNQAEEND